MGEDELRRHGARRLTAGHGPARALRRAMLELRQAHPHPYYWAPFVLIGGSADDRRSAPSAPRSDRLS